MLPLLVMLQFCAGTNCAGVPTMSPPVVVVVPRVTVDRTGDRIEVYGFLPDGRRVGYYLPAHASADDVIWACESLRYHLRLYDSGQWMPPPEVMTPKEFHDSQIRARPRTDPR